MRFRKDAIQLDWLRVERAGAWVLDARDIREWYVCVVPDDSESSDDDAWLLIADILTTVRSGKITRIEVAMATTAVELLEAGIRNSDLYRFIVAWLGSSGSHEFADETPVVVTRFGAEEDYVFLPEANLLLR